MRQYRDRRWLELLRGLAACGLVIAAAAAQADGEAEARGQFRTAYAAAVIGLDAQDSGALREYVLYPYLRAVRIERALAKADGAWHAADTEAAELLAAVRGEPVAQPLRRAWLASLARRTSWDAFVDQYDAAAATPALECQYFNARIALQQTAELAALVRARWLTGRRLPTECEAAFQWLRAQGELPDALVAERARLLLANGQAGFARTVAARLPADDAAPLLERADFIESPGRMLDAMLREPDREVPGPVVGEAFSRLSRNAPDEALTRYAAVSERAPALAAEGQLALALAKGLAWDRRPEALEYFARVPARALDDSGREWWARAAMWSGEWGLVRDTIAAMSPAQRADASWRYWAARAAEQQGEADGARALYASALGGDNYYSAMAAARLDERVVPRLESLPLDEAQVETLAAVAAFRRVRELMLVGLRELATNEWHYGFATLSPDQRLQAIHLAARWEIYDIAVATATSAGRFNDYTLLYPRPYPVEVAAAVKLTELDPQVLYGVLRQESLFRSDAASAAGALGIAQLTPATARETARRWQRAEPTRADLLDPAVGITLGAARVAELLRGFDGQLPVALGAYNAGEAAASRWLPPRAIDSDVWIENIPFNETRAYVRRVLWHSLVFRWLETERPQSAHEWLGKVGRSSSAE